TWTSPPAAGITKVTVCVGVPADGFGSFEALAEAAEPLATWLTDRVGAIASRHAAANSALPATRRGTNRRIFLWRGGPTHHAAIRQPASAFRKSRTCFFCCGTAGTAEVLQLRTGGYLPPPSNCRCATYHLFATDSSKPCSS